MDEINSAFDIEVSPKKENKEKQIQYKKYDKNKHNKEIVKEEIVEPVKQELKSVTEEEVKPIVEKAPENGNDEFEDIAESLNSILDMLKEEESVKMPEPPVDKKPEESHAEFRRHLWHDTEKRRNMVF